MWVPGRKCEGGFDSASNYLTSSSEEKMLSMFKQLVHVAVASAPLLHFPVSERQMNRNDCFVHLCSHLSKLHKTYISAPPCVILCLQTGKKRRDTWFRNCCAAMCFPFQSHGSLLVCSLFSFLEGTMKMIIFYKRVFRKTPQQSKRKYMLFHRLCIFKNKVAHLLFLEVRSIIFYINYMIMSHCSLQVKIHPIPRSPTLHQIPSPLLPLYPADYPPASSYRHHQLRGKMAPMGESWCGTCVDTGWEHLQLIQCWV